MGTLSSCSFSLNPGNGFNFKGRYQHNSIKCFLCGEFLPKRQRLIAKGDFRRLNYVIRSCYNNSSRNDDNGGNGEKENKDDSNLATMTSAEKKSDDSSENSPASTSSRVRSLFIFFLLLLRNSFL